MDVEKHFSVLKNDGGWFLGRQKRRERLVALNRICETGDWRQIWRLTPFLRDKDREIQIATSDAISNLFEKVPSGNRHYESLRYCNISISDLDLFRSTFSNERYLDLLLIASSNLNGYVREKAIHDLGLSNNEKAIRFIIYRLGDWVPEVREASLDAIEKFMRVDYIDGLVKNLPDFDAIARVQRADLSVVYNSLINFVVVENREYIRSKFKSYSEKTRLTLATHLSNTGEVTKNDLELFLEDPSSFIRVKSIEHFESLSEENIAKLLSDRAGVVRRQILYKLQNRDDFASLVRPFLADASASIRQLARYVLRSESTNFAESYADNLINGHAIAPSLLGLAEVDGKEFVQVVDPYLDSPKVKIRKAAFLAFTKLDTKRAHDQAISNLDSELKGLRKISARFLVRKVTPEVLARAREVFRGGSFELKMEMLAMFSRIGGWNAIPDLLLGTIDANKDVREIAVKYLGLWKIKAARLFTRPISSDVENIQKVLGFVFDEHEKKHYFNRNPIDGLRFYLNDVATSKDFEHFVSGRISSQNL